MAQQPQIKPGDDVTSLMIQSGDDVTEQVNNPSLWDKINTPMIDLRGGALKDPTNEFAAEHPIIGGGLNLLTDTLSSMTSPLSAVLGLTGAGEIGALKAGLPKLASALKIPAKIASGGMVLHGGEKLIDSESTVPERLGGLGEAALGGLGLKGPKSSKLTPIAEEQNLSSKGTLPQQDLPLFDNGMQISGKQASVAPVNPTVQKLLIALDDTKPMNKEQQAIYHTERAEKLKAMKGVTAQGQEGYYKQLGALKGEHTKVVFEPLKLEQADVDDLFNQISQHPASIGFNEINAKSGLAKILAGQVPQKSEIDLLQKVFGPEMTTSLMKQLPVIDKAGGLISEAVNLPKSLMASFDLSAPFRQGIGLVHKKEFWTSFDDMLQAFGSDKGLKAVHETIESSPNFNLSQESGLALTDLAGITNREEQFMSSWAERIPGIGRGVRASNRAYVGFLNKLRSDTFSSLVDNAEKAAIKLEKLATNPAEIQAAKLANPKTNSVLAEELANFVNTATGRGSLGKLEQSATALNSMLFSPRLIASRVQMLNPATYINASPVVRKEYLKSLLAIATAGTTVSQLGRLAGGTVDTNPTSADAGKVKFGNTRLDPYGGFQQYLVAASRLISGEQTSSTSGNTYELGSRYGLPTRLDVGLTFGSNKLAPVPKFAWDLLDASKSRPFTVSEEAARLFVPIVIQDIYDLAKEDPKLLPLVIPAGMGMGVQTYQ